MAFFELNDVSKAYGAGRLRSEVLQGVELAIEEGEFVAVVGFSGSGKSTLISLMAGLVEPDGGTIRLAGEPIRGPGPDRGVVFQHYSLLPWLTVRGNVLLAVKKAHAGRSRREQEAIAARYIDLVGLGAARGKRPRELSGGMRQRVAVARGLATDPRVLLLDEPLSALDALTRASLQDEIEAIWRRDRKTVVLVTNDVDEAVLLADRIVPLTPGPRARMGPSFRVQIDRPRSRAALNHDPEFKKIRAQVTRYLLEVGHLRGAAAGSRSLRRPSARPRNLAAPRRRYL